MSARGWNAVGGTPTNDRRKGTRNRVDGCALQVERLLIVKSDPRLIDARLEGRLQAFVRPVGANRGMVADDVEESKTFGKRQGDDTTVAMP